MTDYVYRPDLPYCAYLEAGAQALSNHTWVEDAPPGGREERLVGAPQPSAPPTVAMERQEWHSGIEGVDIPFHWGLCHCLLERGQFALPVEALKRNAKTSSERWAAEQYESARDAFRHGLFAQALETAESAVRGGFGKEGNPREYRALFLIGLIRLGSFSHRDSLLVDLDGAQEAFSQAGRFAAAIQPTDAAWGYAGAAWAAYCNGHLDYALGHAKNAIALRSKFGEAHYLGAKILVRQGQTDAATPFIASALAQHASFASRMIRDADFTLGAAVVDHAIDGERGRAKQRAQAALEPALKRAVEVGILDVDERTPLSLPPGSGAGNAAALLLIARNLLEKNTLFAFAEGEALAGLANETLNAAIARAKSERRAFEQSVRQANRAITQFATFEEGGRALGAGAAKELKKAHGLLAAAEPAVNAATARDFLINHDPARVALAGALQALESCKRTALDEANAKRAEVEDELNRSAAAANAGGGLVLKGAFIGFLVALAPTLYTAMFTGGGSSLFNGDREALLRFIILGSAASAIGAIFGLLAGPMANSNAMSHRVRLESVRTEIDETIDQLRSVPLGSGREA